MKEGEEKRNQSENEGRMVGGRKGMLGWEEGEVGWS